VREATLQLEADLDLPTLLLHFIEEARSMTGARYGALGVLNHDHTALDQFLTVGLHPDEEEKIGTRPTGQGVLGLLITAPHPVRLANLGAHPDSFGVPPNHPPMFSFLGVPITVRDEVYGNLYLTDKIGWSEFTSDDEDLVGALPWGRGSPSRTPVSMSASDRSPSMTIETGWPGIFTIR
jgi:GAF domain-containing protein